MPYNSDGSFTLPTGATNAFAGQTIASATWNSVFTDIQNALSHNLGMKSFAVRAVNFNPSVATDIAINVSITTIRYRVDTIAITNASASLSAGAVGLFTAIGGGGTVVVGSFTLTVTSSLADAANNAQIVAPGGGATTAFSDTSLQFRIITAVGSAATADVILFVRPL
jgi:hypothetical protein